MVELPRILLGCGAQVTSFIAICNFTPMMPSSSSVLFMGLLLYQAKSVKETKSSKLTMLVLGEKPGFTNPSPAFIYAHLFFHPSPFLHSSQNEIATQSE